MRTLLLGLLLAFQAPPITEVRDQKYYEGTDADEKKHKLDLYLPKTEGKAPVVVWIHGGGWKSGDRALYAGLGRRFAQEGIGFAAISYRLSPAVQHPEHIKDCARAFAWVHANVGRHGGNPDRLFVMGQSAGGHLSALLALDPKYLEAEKVPKGAIKGAVPMSGVYLIPSLPADAKGPLKMLSDAFGSDPAACREASPVTHVKNCDFPMLVCTETDDNFRVRPSMELLRAAVTRERIRNVEFFDAQDRNHISIVVRLAAPGDDPTRARILDFVRSRCKELDAGK